MPGKKHLRGVSAKEQREYEHIKESAQRSGRYGDRAKEVLRGPCSRSTKRKVTARDIEYSVCGRRIPGGRPSMALRGRKGSLVRILVVDDNPVVRHYLRALLEQQSTWKVCDEARTGREALQRVEKNPPDMILLDFQMPDLNGLDVARQITKLFPDIPILMVTIYLSKQLAEEARRVGIRGACAKSDVGSIVKAVDTLLHAGTYFPSTSSASS
jgi:CheY-like chemotaxis protein